MRKQTPHEIEARKASIRANREARRKAIHEALDLKPQHKPLGALLPAWSRREAA